MLAITGATLLALALAALTFRWVARPETILLATWWVIVGVGVPFMLALLVITSELVYGIAPWEIDFHRTGSETPSPESISYALFQFLATYSASLILPMYFERLAGRRGRRTIRLAASLSVLAINSILVALLIGPLLHETTERPSPYEPQQSLEVLVSGANDVEVFVEIDTSDTSGDHHTPRPNDAPFGRTYGPLVVTVNARGEKGAEVRWAVRLTGGMEQGQYYVDGAPAPVSTSWNLVVHDNLQVSCAEAAHPGLYGGPEGLLTGSMVLDTSTEDPTPSNEVLSSMTQNPESGQRPTEP